MKVVSTISDLRVARSSLQGRVGLVPTMGYLHDGHVSLVQLAQGMCDAVVVSIYVNPTQFAANEDLDAYPRDMERDLRVLRENGVDLVYIPTSDVMYPANFQTYISVEAVSQGLEGERRPGHFRGVATIVNKLFNQVQPDVAMFGQKDAQQIVVIRRMVKDLDIPVEIVIGPVVREADGLAMSSRNVYLSPEQRSAAVAVSRAWKAAGQAYDEGERDPVALKQIAEDVLATEPLAIPDYVSVNNVRTLSPIESQTDEPVLLSMTVRFGNTRLLDNCLLPLSLNTVEGATAVLGAY